MEEEFTQACREGKLSTLINMHVEGFMIACETGNLELVEWLFNCISLHISNSDCDWAFKMACDNNHIDVARWFLQQKPDRYELVKDRDPSYIVCVINRN